VVAVDATSGKQLWEYDATEEIVTKPLLAMGMVFVVSSADTIYALDQQKGEWRWQYRREAPATDFTVRGAARPAVADGRLFAGFADGFAVSLDARDGTLQWAKDLGGGKPFADVDAGPVLDEEGHVFFASFASGIFALEAATGKLVWTAKRNGVNALALDPATRRLFAGGDGFAASYQARTGTGIWNVSLGADHAVSGIGLANGLMIASTGLGPLLFIDGFNGRLRRSFDPGRGVSAPVNVVGSQAYVLSNRGVLYDLGIEARATP